MCPRRLAVTAVVILFVWTTTAADADVDDYARRPNRDQRQRTPAPGVRSARSDEMSEEPRCDRPSAPRYGRVRVRERGKLAYFRCRRRFQLYGSARAVCIDQAWSHPPPVCVAAGCSQIASGRGMTIMYASAQLRDTVLIFICLPGFQLVGKSTLYCDGSQWSSDKPVCVEHPSTTLSILANSSAASTGDHVTVVLASSLTSPVSLVGPPIGQFSRAPAIMSTDIARSYVNSTSRYVPPSFAVPVTPVAETSAPGSTPVVTQHQRNTGNTVTSSAAAAATTLLRSTSPTWQLSTRPNSAGYTTFSKQYDAVSLTTTTMRGLSSFDHTRTNSLPIYNRSSLWLNDSRPTNDTSEAFSVSHGGRTLLWYAAVGGSSAVALVVVGAACGVAVRRQTPALRRYQLMDGENEMQSMTTATAASGRSTFYATPYSELSSDSVNDQQQNFSLQQNELKSYDDRSFV